MNSENLSKMTLSQEDFGLVQSMLSQRVGISLAAGKEYLVVGYVSLFDFDSARAIQSLNRGNNTQLWDEVVDVLAVHETCSFVMKLPLNRSRKRYCPSVGVSGDGTGY